MKVKTNCNLNIEDVLEKALDSFVCLLKQNGVEVAGDVKDLDTVDAEYLVEVTGEVVPYDGGDYYNPPSGGYVEDVEVLLSTNNKTVDITEFMRDNTMERLEERLIDQYNDAGDWE